jgi:hypothetical protein
MDLDSRIQRVQTKSDESNRVMHNSLDNITSQLLTRVGTLPTLTSYNDLQNRIQHLDVAHAHALRELAELKQRMVERRQKSFHKSHLRSQYGPSIYHEPQINPDINPDKEKIESMATTGSMFSEGEDPVVQPAAPFEDMLNGLSSVVITPFGPDEQPLEGHEK